MREVEFNPPILAKKVKITFKRIHSSDFDIEDPYKCHNMHGRFDFMVRPFVAQAQEDHESTIDRKPDESQHELMKQCFPSDLKPEVSSLFLAFLAARTQRRFEFLVLLIHFSIFNLFHNFLNFDLNYCLLLFYF